MFRQSFRRLVRFSRESLYDGSVPDLCLLNVLSQGAVQSRYSHAIAEGGCRDSVRLKGLVFHGYHGVLPEVRYPAACVWMIRVSNVIKMRVCCTGECLGAEIYR